MNCEIWQHKKTGANYIVCQVKKYRVMGFWLTLIEYARMDDYYKPGYYDVYVRTSWNFRRKFRFVRGVE